MHAGNAGKRHKLRRNMDTIKQEWTRRKPFIMGLVVGLLAGPLVSGIMGWQVTSAFLQRSVHTAIVAQQVGFCEFRARAAVKDPEKLDYTARYALAELWAKMPGQTATDSDVVSGCTNGLG
jgi:hypothetical protein